MIQGPDVDVDILGTMVDEAGGLPAAVREAAPAADGAAVDHLVTVWQEHVEHEQQRIGDGSRTYANSQIVEREAAQRVAEGAGLTDPVALLRLNAHAGLR